MNKKDIEKRAKIIDMMITMHSLLADRYYRRSKLLQVASVLVSTILVALIFVDPLYISRIIGKDLEPNTVSLLIGGSSIIVFFLSMVALIVDWSGLASQHKRAFETLLPLKQEWSEKRAQQNKDAEEVMREFERRSSAITGSLIPVSDKHFNALKRKHYEKIILSKMISQHPGASLLVLKMKIWLQSTFNASKGALPS